MSDKKVLTLSNAETAVNMTVVQDIGGTREPESVSNSIHRWYIDPLMNMEGSTGFLVIMVLLPLYEMHLKVNGHIGKDENFTEGHQVFKVIGRDLGISMGEAYHFWQCFRNGLLHTGIPNESKSFPYSLRTNGPPIERKKDVFYINPFELRNHLLGIIKGSLKKWESHGAQLPVTYIP